jgi:hypothetical protein
VLPGELVPIGQIGDTKFDFARYLNQARTNPFVIDHMDRVWLTGALLNLGDKLQEDNYFDHAPVLELIYHLRNGIAHGNIFNITNLRRLISYPAHNRVALAKSPTDYEMVPSLNGTPVLFDFITAPDVLSLFHSVGFHLNRLAYR